MFTAVPCARSASRHSAYDSHVHGMPVANASTGMSSMKPNTSLARDAVGGAHRRERQRAVAGDDGGHAVLRHRVDERVPPHRRVVVRVAVDEPGRDERAAGVDDRLAVGREPGADLGDHAVADPHVGGARGRARCRRPACRRVTSRSPVMGDDATGSSATRGQRELRGPQAPPEVAGEGAGERGRLDQEAVEVGGVDLPRGHRRARLDPAAVGVAAEHVDVADDGAGDDLADRLAAARSPRPGRRSRRNAAVATEPWSNRQSPGSSSRRRATERMRAWSATEKLPEEVGGLHPAPAAGPSSSSRAR